jgi:hypothetical protein
MCFALASLPLVCRAQRDTDLASVVPLGALESEEESLQEDTSEESEDELEEEQDAERPIDSVHVLLAALRHPKQRWKADAATWRTAQTDG